MKRATIIFFSLLALSACAGVNRTPMDTDHLYAQINAVETVANSACFIAVPFLEVPEVLDAIGAEAKRQIESGCEGVPVAAQAARDAVAIGKAVNNKELAETLEPLSDLINQATKAYAIYRRLN